MSHTRIRRLRAIQTEFEATKSSLQLAMDEWASLHSHTVMAKQNIQDIRLAYTRLENTYLIRLFAEYEAVLREYCDEVGTPAPYNVKSLIDRIGRMRRIDVIVRGNAHDVRERRNAIVHRGGNTVSIRFSDALANLNRFLSWLPDPT